MEKPVLIHTHFHKRRTGITRSIENVFPFFSNHFESYIYGYNIKGKKITKSKLRKILFSNRKVIVHCHRNNEILKMLFWRFIGAKFSLIVTRHAATKPSKFTFSLLKKADKVITLIKSMSVNLGVKNTMISHGVNIEEFTPKENVSLKQIHQKNIILNVGRVRKAKGQLVLLEAAAVLQKYSDWALVIVGKVKPDFLDELKVISSKYQIGDQVYFIEETKDILSYYQAAKIVVAPSFSEGFSLVTAEAMACECTTLATKNVGVHDEMITHTKNGYLFEAGNSKELAKTLEGVITKKLPLLGKAAREEIIKNWSAKKESQKLIELYLTDSL